MSSKVEEELGGKAAEPVTGKHAAKASDLSEVSEDKDSASLADSSKKQESDAQPSTKDAKSSTDDARPSAKKGDTSEKSSDSAGAAAKTSSRPKVPEKAKLTESEKAAATAKAAKKQTEKEAAAKKRDERLDEVAKKRKRRKRKRVIKRICIALALLLLGLLLSGIVAFGVMRWVLVDDAADIQGIWQINGTEKTIEITEDLIILTDEVSYKYTLNPTDKTIEFTFGNLSGNGKYRFSLDRQQLSITDGEYNWFSNAVDDALWSIYACIVHIQGGEELSPGEGEGVTALTREQTEEPSAAPAADQTSASDAAQTQSPNASSAGSTDDQLHILDDPTDIVQKENQG